jgi:hypothetical protein
MAALDFDRARLGSVSVDPLVFDIVDMERETQAAVFLR